MEKCTNCGQDLGKEDKFCRNCGQPVESINNKEEELNGETIVPNFNKNKMETSKEELGEDEDTNSFVLDTSIIEKARIEKIKKEIEETKNKKEEEERDYKDYELAKTQVIGDINQYLDDEEDLDDEDYYEEEYTRDPRHNNQPRLDKKILMGIGLAVLGILIIIASLVFLRNRKDLGKEEVIENFIAALEARDESELLSILKPGDPKLKIDKMGLKAYFNYIDENPSYIDTVKFELEEQSKFYDEHKNKDIGPRFENIVLRNNKGDYYLEVKPYYIDLKVPMEGVEIYLEDKKLDITDRDNYKKEFGPYMPGIYKLKGRLTSASEEDTVEEELILFDEKPDTGKLIKEIELDLKLISFKLETNEPEAMIIINGQATNKRVRELENGILGPLAKSSRLQLVYKAPFGEVKSREIELSEVGEVLKLNIDYTSSPALDKIIDSINTFVKDDAKAKENLDETAYTNVVEPELSKRINIIVDMKDLDQSIETDLIKISYDLDSFNIKEHEGAYYGVLNAKLDLEETILTDFSVEKNPESKNFSYLLVYDQAKKTWSIYDVEATTSFNLANTREHRF